MISIARKNLFAEKTRLFISVGGVAFSVLLILVLLSLYQGWQSIITGFINSVKADLWVMQEGASDMFHSVSIVPLKTQEKLEEVEGVEKVERLLMRQISFELEGEKAIVYLVGYKERGGPVEVISGEGSPKKGEVVIDEVFANNKDLGIGDEITISGKKLRIVGISKGGNFIFSQLAFVPLAEAEEILEMQGLTNFFLVSLADGRKPGDVAGRINQSVPGVKALSHKQFLANNEKILEESFLPVIYVLVLISFGVGVAVIGLTVYTAVVEKSQEYGILKAIGAGNSYLYRTIFEQSLISALLGFVIGVVLAYGVNYVASAYVPEFVTEMQSQDVLLVFGASILMSLLASYIPVKKIAGIDPMEVFRS
ncbi:MAG: ABC transporter permease [Patescibacteria group bacterium]|nr:MAG: ABC transporter permease [Patescibacteria group bacterium]